MPNFRSTTADAFIRVECHTCQTYIKSIDLTPGSSARLSANLPRSRSISGRKSTDMPTPSQVARNLIQIPSFAFAVPGDFAILVTPYNPPAQNLIRVQ